MNVFFIIAHHPSAGQIYTPVPVCFFQKRRLTKHLSVDILGVQTAMLCKVYGIGQRKKGGDRYETLPALQFAYHPARPQDLPSLRQSAVRPNRRGTAQAAPMGAVVRFAPWRWWSCTLPCTSPSPCPQTFRSRPRPHRNPPGWCWTKPDRFYLDNLPTNITFTLTVDGAEQPHGTSDTRPATTWPAVP